MRAVVTMINISKSTNTDTATIKDVTSNERVRTQTLEDTTLSEVNTAISNMYNNYSGDITVLIQR